jgi:hypothetical protein
MVSSMVTQVMTSTVKSVKAMQNHMKENCDLIYGAPSLPFAKQNPNYPIVSPEEAPSIHTWGHSKNLKTVENTLAKRGY